MTITKARNLSILLLPLLALSACGGDSPSVPKDRPDLQITSMTVTPASPIAGQPVEVSAIVKNFGTAAAPATNCGVTVDGTQTCMEISTAALAILQADTVSCSIGGLAMGSHGVGFCADVTDLADEPDESNNCTLQMVQVGAGVGEP